jgi:tRNA nucleotidyltransferase (CCA-adding enzyme)
VIELEGLKTEIVRQLTTRGSLYEVGGCVRDSLIGRDVAGKDRDYLVTGIPLDDLVRLLTPYGKVDLVGRSFGVIKFTSRSNGSGPSETVDIAIPRREFSTGVDHRDFQVDYDYSLPVEDDLRRRDFTINAMARNLATGQIIDPLHGKSDLDKRVLRMVSEISFEEDPLRVLRGVQFVARFSLQPEHRTLISMRNNAHLIRTVTPERISEELDKLLTRAERPSVGFDLLREIGMLDLILPELSATIGVEQPGGYHAYDVFEHSIRTVDATPPRLNLRWAALLHDITKPSAKRETEDGGATFYGHETTGARLAKRILRRLRYSNEFIRDVSTLVDRHMFSIPPTDKGLRRLVRKTGVDLIFDLLDLRRADVVGQGMGNKTDDVDAFEKRIREELVRKPPFSVADLAVDGGTIMQEFNIPESPLIGKILDHLLEFVLDNPDMNKEEVLIKAVRDYLQSEETQ